MVTPFVLYIIWGIVLIAAEEVSYHVGFGITFLTISVHSLLLSVLSWWVRRWRVTIFMLVMGGTSIVFLFCYLFSVTFLPEIFSYTGTTAIFMSITFIFVSVAHFEIDLLKNKILIKSFVDAMDDDDSEGEQESTVKVIEDVKKRSRYINYIVIGVMVIAYICALIAYSILVLVNDWAKDNEKTHLGFTNSLIIGFTDTILICWGTFSVRGIYLSPFHSSVALGITRAVICFSPTYWILIDASVFCILLLVFITCWIWKNIEVETVKSKRQKMQKNIYESVSKTEHLREYLIKEKLVTDAGLDAAH